METQMMKKMYKIYKYQNVRYDKGTDYVRFNRSGNPGSNKPTDTNKKQKKCLNYTNISVSVNIYIY